MSSSDSSDASVDNLDEVGGSKSDKDRGDTNRDFIGDPVRRSLREELASLKHQLIHSSALCGHCDSCM